MSNDFSPAVTDQAVRSLSIRDQVAHLIAFQELEHLTGQRFSETELTKMEEAAQAQGHTLEEALARFLYALRNISQDDLAKVAERQGAPQREKGSL